MPARSALARGVAVGYHVRHATPARLPRRPLRRPDRRSGVPVRLRHRRDPDARCGPGSAAAAHRPRQPRARGRPAALAARRRDARRLAGRSQREFPRLPPGRQPAHQHALRRGRTGAPRRLAARRPRTAHLGRGAGGRRRGEPGRGRRLRLLARPRRRRERADLPAARRRTHAATAHRRQVAARRSAVVARRRAARVHGQRTRRHRDRCLPRRGRPDGHARCAAARRRLAGPDLDAGRLVAGRFEAAAAADHLGDRGAPLPRGDRDRRIPRTRFAGGVREGRAQDRHRRCTLQRRRPRGVVDGGPRWRVPAVALPRSAGRQPADADRRCTLGHRRFRT